MNPVYRTILGADWLTLVLIGSLLLLTVGKYFFQPTFWAYLILPFNNKYLTLNKKKGRLFSWFHLLLTFFQLCNSAVFAFLVYDILVSKNARAYPTMFFLILGVLVLYLLFKIILQFGVGYFFESYTTVSDLIFEKLTFFNYSGLIAFCGNIILIYVLPNSKTVVYTTIGLICLINLIGLFNVVRIHQKLILNNILYFILYLCTLEISPLVLLGSFLND